MRLPVEAQLSDRARRHSALSSAITGHYRPAITRLRSLTSPIAADRIGYLTNGIDSTFIEYSTTGRRFAVTVKGSRIVSENVKPLALVF